MWGLKNVTTPAAEWKASVPVQPVTPSPTAQPDAPPTAILGDEQPRIGKSLILKGEITGSEDLFIDGEFEGTIKLKENSLTVGPNGDVRADVQARSVTVFGRLQGDVNVVERIGICTTGSLEGDVVTPRIVIEDGAVFRGSVDILKVEKTTTLGKTKAVNR